MDKEGYHTKNLNIAAFLYASGLELVKTARINGDFYFYFVPQEKAQELVESYFSNKARISPRDLFARLNDLRDLIFQGGRNG